MSTLVLDKDKKNRQESRPGWTGNRRLQRIGKNSAAGLPLLADPERDAAGHLPGETLYRGQPVQGTQPDDGRSAAHRGCRERRQRHARSRRVAHADSVPYLERSQPASRRRAGGASRDQVETRRAQAIRLQSWRGHLHRHARRSQGLFPRSRPFRLCRSVGLGARHHRRAAESRVPEGDCRQNLEGDRGSGKVCAVPVSAVERPALSRICRRN